VTGWLLDTNVLSAFGPGKPALSAEVATWFRQHSEALFISTITVAEIEAGIAKLRRLGADRRASQLRAWFDRILAEYADRVLSFDLGAARIAGTLIDSARAGGRHPGAADISIAAIARSQGLTVLTANLRHFEPLGVEVINPLSSQ